MMHKTVISLPFILLIALQGFTNNHCFESLTLPVDSGMAVHGLVLDSKNQSPLPYTHIYVLSKHKGAISNEQG